ncbi:MAG: cytochrome P450 [Bauldia sp.]
MTRPPKSRAPPCPVDFLTADFTRDRIAGYRAIRQAGPLVWYRPARGFLVTGYRDTTSALRDQRLAEFDIFFDWRKLGPKLGRDYSQALEFFSYMPFRHEGQRHAQLRRAMATGVAPYVGGHPAIRARIDRTLAGVVDDGGCDLANQFANFLFFDVMCDLLAIGEDERGFIKPIATMSRLLESTLPLSHRNRFADHIGGYVGFLREHAARALQRQEPGFFTGVHNALPADEPDKLKATAILATIILMMGNDAIGGCISFPVDNLLSETDRQGRPLVAQPSWAEISDDAIRFASPVDLLTRVATEDVEIVGCLVEKGETLIFSLICANHDPAEFGEWADSVTVKPNKETGIPFGAGSHLCVGNRLARVVVKEAYEALARLPQMRISGDLVYGEGRVVRTIASLPVEFN